ncbi:MAG TPA: hypothetical protein VF715_00955 [Thermoleophilaceae bacterium]
MTEAEALVRAVYREWERGDFSSREWATPAFELVLADGPNPGAFRGDDVARAWGDMIAMWDDFRAVAEMVRDLGDMLTRGANVIHVRDGKVTRLVAYFNRDQALAELEHDGGSASPPPP